MPSLTIATATYDDYLGLVYTLQHLALLDDPLVSNAEVLVVDNHPTKNPDGSTSNATAKLETMVKQHGGRYVAMPEPHGTAAPRNRCVQEATGDVVLVMDSHVLLSRHTAAAVCEYFSDPDHCHDILSGPQLSKQRTNPHQPHRLAVMSTHYADVWRAEMWGIWAQAWLCTCRRWHFDVRKTTDKPPCCEYYPVALGRGPADRCPECDRTLPDLPHAGHAAALQTRGYLPRGYSIADTEPFEIPGHGLGMFAVRREHWIGFPPGMVGFGGGELHLHEQTRRAGGRAVCHPQAAWWHSYERSTSDGKPPYRCD